MTKREERKNHDWLEAERRPLAGGGLRYEAYRMAWRGSLPTTDEEYHFT